MKPTLTFLTAFLLTSLVALPAADNSPYPVAKFSIEHAVINQSGLSAVVAEDGL